MQSQSEPAPAASTLPSPSAPSAQLEPHYTVPEIAKQWQVCDDTVRALFYHEPGVLKIGRGSRLIGARKKKLRRHWYMLRIPHSVLVRVQAELMGPSPGQQRRPAESIQFARGPALRAG